MDTDTCAPDVVIVLVPNRRFALLRVYAMEVHGATWEQIDHLLASAERYNLRSFLTMLRSPEDLVWWIEENRKAGTIRVPWYQRFINKRIPVEWSVLAPIGEGDEVD